MNESVPKARPRPPVVLVIKRPVSRVRREDPIADGVAALKREASDKDKENKQFMYSFVFPLGIIKVSFLCRLEYSRILRARIHSILPDQHHQHPH